MKKIIAIIFMCLSVITGCTKPESKIIGKWVSDPGGSMVLHFFSDNTGVEKFTLRNKVRTASGGTLDAPDIKFTWKMYDGKIIKRVNASGDVLVYTMEGNTISYTIDELKKVFPEVGTTIFKKE